jgi:hypothetical protein
VIHSSSSVSAVVWSHADHRSEAVAHTTKPTTNHGRRCQCIGGRMTNHRTTDRTPPAMVMTAAVSSPNACTQAVPESPMNRTKMHHPRSIRWPVFSRTGGAGGADAGCFEWTAIA